MKNRKAIINEFGTSAVIKIIEEEIPEPKAGEARIRIEASTVSATDIFIRKGIYPLLKEKPPFTLGYDFVGIVDKVGEGVYNIKVGARVCSIVMICGNAEYICTNAIELTVIPKDIDTTAAACLTLSGITAYQMFKHVAKVKNGQRILVHGGSGAIGNTLIQLGRLINCTIIATASSTKHPLIESYGAISVDYKSSVYFARLKELAADGFDAVFDFTNQKSFNQSFKLLKKGGTLVTYAVFSSSLKIEKKTFANFMSFGMDFGLMMLKLAIWNALPNGKYAQFYGSTDYKKDNRLQHQQDMNELFELVYKGFLKPHIHSILNLADVKLAHEMLQSGKVQGQLILKTETDSVAVK
ncbi:MAG: zinc-binding dehydrogenase [Ferruginibacter sp.]|nr:zinc-binding dehydrogenase [Ferruginibacter sp.]